MPVDIATVVVGIGSWGATYLVHSSFLLAGVWVFLKIHPAMGHVLKECFVEGRPRGRRCDDVATDAFVASGAVWRIHIGVRGIPPERRR